ncbi:DedA family protein [Candidatus Gottesmanbacteria bacterium]|nr:DedA family protein [Candidatus Gottesmanbacteria bacterium]
MFESLLETLASWIINIISSTGYAGIFILMAIESALIPLPSEVTMPFSGSLVALGRFNLILVAIAGALGNLAGSLLAYALGFWGQENVVRLVIRKYGKYLLISEHEFERAEKWFRKYGEVIVFSSRLMPVVRTFISLPAGIVKMNLTKFIVYTTIGSFFWSLFLAYIGMVLGQNWKILETYFRRFDMAIIIGGVVLIGFYLYHKVKKSEIRN